VKERSHCTARFFRGHLHAGLAAHVDQGRIQLRKKVVGVAIEQEGVKVIFEDGSEVRADVVVGADGLHSVSFPEGLESRRGLELMECRV